MNKREKLLFIINLSMVMFNLYYVIVNALEHNIFGIIAYFFMGLVWVVFMIRDTGIIKDKEDKRKDE